MKSMRARLTIWFAASCIAVAVVFVGFTYRVLELELREKQVAKAYPNHPDWTLHGNASEAEVRDILGELFVADLYWAIPMAVLSLVIGYVIARKSLRPVVSINQQLQSISPTDLTRRIELGEMDAEFREVVGHLNDLLSRLERSFNDMSEYAAKVTHELRTPLAIMRLKLEQAGEKIPAELSEDLQGSVHQLTHVVDQLVLMTKAEQGRLVLNARPFDLSAMILDVSEDFSLLAQEAERRVRFQSPSEECRITADPKYMQQIIHNLLTNALKHGQGDIQLRLVRRGERARLTIANRVRREPAPSAETFGLGLRVVDRLLHLQPDIRHLRRRGRTYYAAQFIFKTVRVERAAEAVA